jgi:hypothetical protein
MTVFPLWLEETVSPSGCRQPFHNPDLKVLNNAYSLLAVTQTGSIAININMYFVGQMIEPFQMFPCTLECSTAQAMPAFLNSLDAWTFRLKCLQRL